MPPFKLTESGWQKLYFILKIALGKGRGEADCDKWIFNIEIVLQKVHSTSGAGDIIDSENCQRNFVPSHQSSVF